MAKAGEKALAEQETIVERTKKDMQMLAVYKPEYDPLINLYAELVVQYNTITEKFRKSGFKFQESTADGGFKKAPIVATLEALRKDILAYSDRLCLNPKSLESLKPATGKGKKKSTLADTLKSFG